MVFRLCPEQLRFKWCVLPQKAPLRGHVDRPVGGAYERPGPKAATPKHGTARFCLFPSPSGQRNETTNQLLAKFAAALARPLLREISINRVQRAECR